MKLLVLDTRHGDCSSELFLLDPAHRSILKKQLAYAPEIHYDAAARELVVVETELPDGSRQPNQQNWLRRYRVDTLEPIDHIELPDRPMYAGFPNRSTRIVSTPSGRYVYTLAQQMVSNFPVDDDVFRISVLRYDRATHTLTPSPIAVDSCLMEFGWRGPSEEDLYFHLTCELPATVATGRFSSPDLCFHTLEHLEPRTYSPRQTCGSWMDPADGSLYCVTGEGTIHQLPRPGPTKIFVRLALQEPDAVPLKMLYGSNGHLFLGVSRSDGERSLSLASEIRRIAVANPEAIATLSLPFPILNFVVSPDGSTLAGVSPYDRAVCVLDACSGDVIRIFHPLGVSPAEVLFLPAD